VGLPGGRGSSFGPAYDAGANTLMLFQVLFMETAGYIIVGAICERITFGAFLLCELFVGALLYPIFGNWVWGGGWMSELGASMGLGHGYVDFAGSTVVHAVGGFCAMALAVILGPRIGKYTEDGKPVPFPAHNLVFVVTEHSFCCSAGWIQPGLDTGEPLLPDLSRGCEHKLLAAIAPALRRLCWSGNQLFGKPDITMACNGMLAGLVAITAPCAFVGPTSAVIIGIIAGALVCGGVLFNERVLKIDDPCGAISVHGFCGWFGAVAVGIFADGSYGAGWNGIGAASYLGAAGRGVTGLLHGDTSQFMVQLGDAVPFTRLVCLSRRFPP
jgi:Amt family ammonium transporter